MIARIHVSKKSEGLLWYVVSEDGIRHTVFASIGTVQTDQSYGFQIIFLVFSFLIAWRIRK